MLNVFFDYEESHLLSAKSRLQAKDFTIVFKEHQVIPLILLWPDREKEWETTKLQKRNQGVTSWGNLINCLCVVKPDKCEF